MGQSPQSRAATRRMLRDLGVILVALALPPLAVMAMLWFWPDRVGYALWSTLLMGVVMQWIVFSHWASRLVASVVYLCCAWPLTLFTLFWFACAWGQGCV